MGYVPGFDGLRGLLLPALLIYHHGFEGLPGAIFLVSMFFTLSGFLIGTLALAEHGRRGTISLTGFWERRIRRLLPAALVTLAAVVAMERIWGIGSSPRFDGDVVSALAYVANWRMAFSGADYAAIFSTESPVQHFWSLSIEEQFYLLFPLAFVGLMRMTRGRWGVVGLVLGAAAAASFAAAWVVADRRGNSGLAYYATYTRASEILFGVALAFVVATKPVARLVASPAAARAIGWLGIAGLAGQAWLWRNVGLTDPFVFRGGTILNATCTALCIVACLSPRPGLLVRTFDLWPVRNFGKLTYGVYLIHWPLFLVVDEERTGLGTWPLFVLRCALTVALAVASYHYLEAPFRTAERVPRRRLAPLLVAPMLALLAVLVVVPPGRSEVLDLAAIDGEGSPGTAEAVVPQSGDEASAARVLLVGDSVAWSALHGLEVWNEQHDEQVLVDAYYAIGCTVGEAGEVRALGILEQPFETCLRFRDQLPAQLAAADYDAIVVLMGQKDLTDRRIDGVWTHLGEPRFDRWFRTQVDALADLLAAEGAPVLWSTAAHLRLARANDPTSNWQDYPDNDPARVDRLNQIVREQLAERPGFTVLEVDEWLHGLPGGEFDEGTRADSVHFTRTGSVELARFVVPRVLAVTGARSDAAAGG
jgi:peptidoglycan/LPS O-acetylase OafA/YrhL